MIVSIIIIIIISLIFIYSNKLERFVVNELPTIYCINMNKSKSRWNKILNICNKQSIAIKRFPAINGKKLDINSLLKNKIISTKLKRNHPTSFQGSVGCYLSHLNLWKKFNKLSIDYFIVIEDDIILEKQFMNLFYMKLKYVPDDWDILYLGATRACGKKINSHVLKVNYRKCKNDNGGLFGYVIRKKALPYIINFCSKTIDKMIDHKLRDAFPNLNVYHLYPPLIKHDFLQKSVRGDRIYPKYYQDKAKQIKLTI